VRLPLASLMVVAIGCQAPGLPEATAVQALVNILPATHDFASVAIGATSSVYTVVVNPAGLSSDDSVTAVTASCPDFVVNAVGLPANVYRTCEVICLTGGGDDGADPDSNAICPIQARICETTGFQDYRFDTAFRPTVAGTVSCVVTVVLNGGTASKTVTLTGTGLAPPKRIAVQPASVAFGDVRRTTSSGGATITVSSIGGEALTVSSAVVTGAGFSMTGPAAYTLAPGASQSHGVLCQPTATGAIAGALTLTSDDPAQPTMQVNLSCNGIDSNLDVTPSPAALTTTRVGEPIDTMITLRNTGGAAMQLERVALTGPGITMTSAPPPGTILAAVTGSAQVGVRFAAAASGEVRAALIATYDGGQTRSTEVTARALGTSMALTPDGDVDFGPVCAGKAKLLEFTMIGNDQGSFTVESISMPEPPFTIAPPSLPALIKGAGATQTRFQVTASPVAAAVSTATVVVATDIPGAPDRTLHLSVQGLPAGITATPELLDLGARPVNTTTIGQEVHLSNCDAGPVAFSNARIEGDDASEFAIVAQPSTAMIAPAGLVSWLVVLQARSVGPKRATFAVDYEGGTATVALDGEGLGDRPNVSARGSYYACATGQPSSAWPLVVALALVLRRRRR
jgi:MYXO-CTERM domain-containing protein